MAGEELGYDYGMMPGFPDADMNDARFDSNSTPPLATDFELDESQGSATASSRPEEIELYLQGFDSNYDQSPEELFFPRNEESAFFAPSLLVSQHQLESYVHENTYQRGSQSMGTIAQPMGDFSVPSLHVNAQSSYHEFANNPQGDTHDPGMAFQNNPQGFDPPMMDVDPPGVPSQMVYPVAQGVSFGNSPYPANPHLYRQGQYYQQGQYHSAQAQQLQYQQGQGHYRQGQHQQDLGLQAQFQQAQFQQGPLQQAQYHQGQYQQYQQGQGQPAQTQPPLSISQRRAPQVRATPTWPRAIPLRQIANISQASHSSNPNNTNGPQTGTSPSTYNSYGQFVPPALHTTLGTRSISNTTQSSFTTETDLSVNANLPFPINVNNPAGAGTSAQPGLPTLAANTPDPLAPHETLQGGDEQGQPGPADPSSSQRTRGHRTGPLSERQREDARNRKENLTVCARCKWKNRGCDCGDEGITRCTTCSSGRSNACVCTRHHFLPLVEQGGATQFTEHHCIYTLVSYQSLKSYTISQITTDITDYVSNGCTHIKLYRTGMQAHAECTFDLNTCLSLFRHIGTEFARFPTFRDVMDHVVPHESIRARLQTCMPSLDEDCFNLSNFKLNALIDDEGHPSGASFQFQLFSNASASSVGTQNQLSRLGAILFLILGRQIELEIFSALSKNLKQKVKDPSTIRGLNYLQQRLFMMRLAYRKCSQSATGERTEVDINRLWDLCQHLANVHFCKQEWAVRAMRPLHVPPTLFPQGFTNASFEAWMA